MIRPQIWHSTFNLFCLEEVFFLGTRASMAHSSHYFSKKSRTHTHTDLHTDLMLLYRGRPGRLGQQSLFELASALAADGVVGAKMLRTRLIVRHSWQSISYQGRLVQRCSVYAAQIQRQKPEHVPRQLKTLTKALTIFPTRLFLPNHSKQMIQYRQYNITSPNFELIERVASRFQGFLPAFKASTRNWTLESPVSVCLEIKESRVGCRFPAVVKDCWRMMCPPKKRKT